MHRDLEEFIAKCADHLHLGAQVREVHVIEYPFNKEESFCKVLHLFMCLMSIVMYMVMNDFH